MGEHHAAPGADASRERAQPPGGGTARTGRDVPGAGTGPPQHTPVLLERCLELLDPAVRRPGAVHVDATLGLGGHAEAVLVRYPGVRLIGLDRDPRALELSGQRLAPYADRVILVHAVYDELPAVLRRHELDTVDSVLFDLGVSSMQLDETARGFAYSREAPLDMRMDPTAGITAEEVVNTYPPADLVRILRAYGEERFAPRIVSAIVRERARARITSTARLAELIQDAIPAATRRTGGHPAKRSFQALRIEVNRELAALESAMPAALDALRVGGRIVVLAYHSLEDRIVKRAMAGRATSSTPVDLPVELPGSGPTLRLLTRGAELPTEAEVTANPRAASVRLRAAERIEPADGTRRPAMRQPRAPGRPRPRPGDASDAGPTTAPRRGAERTSVSRQDAEPTTQPSRGDATDRTDQGEGL